MPRHREPGFGSQIGFTDPYLVGHEKEQNADVKYRSKLNHDFNTSLFWQEAQDWEIELEYRARMVKRAERSLIHAER